MEVSCEFDWTNQMEYREFCGSGEFCGRNDRSDDAISAIVALKIQEIEDMDI
jgi:hypothetical protein